MGDLTGEARSAVGRMEEYLLSRLREPATMRGVAAAAGYSPSHAARLFREATGLSPFEYLRRERLAGSAGELRAGGRRVLDVALDFAFDSHEGFTRAFASAFGIPPKRYASLPTPRGWQIPKRPMDRKRNGSEEDGMDGKASIVFTQIMDRPARKLIFKRSERADDYFSYCEEFGCGKDDYPLPAEALMAIKEALYEVVGAWLPEGMRREGTGSYVSAVEVPADYERPLPEGFESIDLAPCQMLVFQGEPFEDADYGRAIGDLMGAIERFKPEAYGYRYADAIAPRMQLAPYGWRGYIELRPVERVG